jgi:hypothetical protein
LQTVAGKTGTCIGSGGWVGLFTSYAPLANPRLAVVVIAQGTDARSHFPAAVAGEIYRELNHRFGTAINMQVATTADDEEKEGADAEAKENGETVEGDDATVETNATGTVATTPTPDPKPATPAKAPASEPFTPRGTVKQVLMPIEKKPVEQKKPTAPTATPKKTEETTPATEQRPRRTQPEQP